MTELPKPSNAFRTIFGESTFLWDQSYEATRLIGRDINYVNAERRIINAKLDLAQRLANGDDIPMVYLLKYSEQQAFNSTPDYDDEAIRIVVEAPLQPQARPQILQQQPQIQQQPHHHQILNQHIQQQPHHQILNQHQNRIFMNQQMNPMFNQNIRYVQVNPNAPQFNYIPMQQMYPNNQQQFYYMNPANFQYIPRFQ